jgi:hypothetical protein
MIIKMIANTLCVWMCTRLKYKKGKTKREEKEKRGKKDIKRDAGFKSDCPLHQLLFSSSARIT